MKFLAMLPLLSLLGLACLPLSESQQYNGGCGDLGCSDMLTLYVERIDSNDFPAGPYLFSLDPQSSAPLTADCRINSGQSLSCDTNSGQLTVNLNSGGDEFTLRLLSAPPQLLLEVYYESSLLGDASLYPDYQLVFPGDPECDLSCTQGSAAIKVAGPS